MHTNFRQGQRVLLIFRDGRQELDHFHERRNRHIVTRRLGWILKDSLRAITIPR